MGRPVLENLVWAAAVVTVLCGGALLVLSHQPATIENKIMKTKTVVIGLVGVLVFIVFGVIPAVFGFLMRH